MRVGLFVPCYVDQMYPRVGIAALRLLEKAAVQVEYPFDQTCCGQPIANAGFEKHALGAMENFVRAFEAFDYVVAPSGSCVHHVRQNYSRAETPDLERRGILTTELRLRNGTYELCEFLTT